MKDIEQDKFIIKRLTNGKSNKLAQVIRNVNIHMTCFFSATSPTGGVAPLGY